MRINTDSGYYSRRGTMGRFGGGMTLRGIGVFVDAQGHVVADDPALDAACVAGGGVMDAFGNCVSSRPSVVAADSQNPYLATSAYEATQGGVTPGQSAQAAFADYCATSRNNALVFGTAVDPECTGADPLNIGVEFAPDGFNQLTASAPTGTSFSVAPPNTNALSNSAPGAPKTPAAAQVNAGGGNAINPNVSVNSGTPAAVTAAAAAAASATPGACGGIGVGSCLGPLDLGTWGLIAAAAFVAFMMMMGRK